jgi:sugar phosphate isomerase/epimerase
MSAIANLAEANRRLGAFARIFQRSNSDELAEAFEAFELTQVQLNLSALGLPTIPPEEERRRLDLGAIRRSFAARGREIWGISATYNTAHPEANIRRTATRRAARFIATLAASGATAATLCSGSRDSQNMWGRHSETKTKAAWRDFRESLDLLIPAAEEAGVLLAVEPEPANTVSDASRALRLLDELGADGQQIGFILDPANLISDVATGDRDATLEHAFDVLGERTICVHAKDTVPWARNLEGDGVVDYALVAHLYAMLPHSVPLIIQDASEAELAPIADMLRERLLSHTNHMSEE